MEKNFIKKVTNLEREKKYYVPIELLKEALYKIQDISDEEDLIENSDSEIAEYLDEIRSQAYSQKKELFVIDNKDDKKDISICPYCNGKMFLSFSNNNRRVKMTPYKDYSPIRGGDSISYKCGYCGASSPNIYLRIALLDEDMVKKDIQREIEGAIEEIRRDEEGEYDD